MFRPIFIILIVLISLQSQAVHLSKDGTGQVLIFPYYTVNGGIDTLINLVNTTDEAKALRVRFREAANSREVFTFNLYLGPNDVWAGAVIKSGEPEMARIISFDQSCTVPNVSSNTQQFNNSKYTGFFFRDSYSKNNNRMFEGFVEVFEMGVMTGDSAEAAIIVDNNANDCSMLENAWNAGGYWSENAGTDMLAPSGGITGNITLIHVGEGFAINQEPTVLENFTDTILNYNTDNDSPSLADGNLTADIESNGVLTSITWPTGFQAVSALLMKDTISNEFALDAEIGAKTDWIMTLPTRHYHVDSEYSNSESPIAPFEIVDFACEAFNVVKIFDREEQIPLIHIGDPVGTLPPGPTIINPHYCFASNNLNFLFGGGDYSIDSVGLFLSNYPTTNNNSGELLGFKLESEFYNGWVELQFDQQSQVISNDEEFTLYGLPVIGFSTQKFTNSNAQPGLLAQYTGIFQHKYTSKITRDKTPENNHEMHIAKNNKGQVLLFPYYTVRNNLNTVISVVNTTDQVKALRVRFLEGTNSRDVLDFNLYLSPYDVWTAALIPALSTVNAHIDEPSVKIVMFDKSCTTPAINGQEFLPYGYTGAFSDNLGENMMRVQEGSIEIFEMGTLLGSDANAATHNASGVPASCNTLVGNWLPPIGKWLESPNDNVEAPDGSGGLFASVSLVDVAEGADMNYDATAIVNFTTEINHRPPGDLPPNLSTGNINKTRITTDDGVISSTWNSPVDAVTALFMQSEIINDFVIEAGIHAETEWVSSYPTKPFYTDPFVSDSETAIAPFNKTVSAPYGSCESHTFMAFNRDQDVNDGSGHFPVDPPPPNYSNSPQECWSVNVADVNQGDNTNSILGSTLDLNDWNNNFIYTSVSDLTFSAGWMKRIYDIAAESKLVGMGENNQVHEIYGKPVLGFVVQKYTNDNAQPGLLANYAVININKGKRKITVTEQ